MNRERLAVLAGLGVLVVAVALAFAAGVGPFSGEEDPVGDFPTETPAPTAAPDGGAGDGGGGGAGGGDGAGGPGAATGGATEEPTPQRPFALRIESVEPCGQTCRDVTATLINQQDQQASGTTVYTRIYEGKGTDGDVVWEGSHEVGTLGPGASDTETQRVQLSYFEAIEIQQNGGWITIVTSVDTDRQTVTFREQRDVTSRPAGVGARRPRRRQSHR